MPREIVDRQAELGVLEEIDRQWSNGWQPSELLRQCRRSCGAAGGRLVAVGMAHDHSSRRSTTLDARWVAQVDDLDLPAVSGRPGWIASWGAAAALTRSEVLAAVVDVLANVAYLPKLDPILPPPGEARAGADGPSQVRADQIVGAESDPVLAKIRALLAKAESTTFEAEAMTFTAKAQELMTRHAVDAALLQSSRGAGDRRPVATRVPVDPPYAEAKYLMLQILAEHTRCRAVFDGRLQLATVVGFGDDLAAVEVLFTSLLLQAQTAMSEAAKHAPAGTRPRSQQFRSAFLLAYGHRIGDRLQEINAAVYADVEAEQGSGFLPVLRSQSEAIDDYLSDHFGQLITKPTRGGYDPIGWASGQAAADRAELTHGRLSEEAF